MKKLPSLFSITAFLLVLDSASANQPDAIKPGAPGVTKPVVTETLYGEASWYEVKCNGGTRTASGIPLRDYAMTAAHKTLPMGTMVRVTNQENGKSVVVKITDRGPYIKGRIIDVTKGAAIKLGLIKRGIVDCKVEVLKKRSASVVKNG